MDDETLVQRCLEGDREAFGEIVSRYERPLFHVALRTLGNAEDARDATQSAFVKAWLHLRQFDRSRRLFSWLYRIALNEALNRLRARRQTVDLDECLVDSGQSPEESTEERERRQLLDRAMARLSGQHREVLMLRHWLQLSYEEIADALGIPSKTVKSRLFAARSRLGDVLREMGVGAS